MAVTTIGEARLTAAHDGTAELVIDLVFENGAVSQIVLDEGSAAALFEQCGVTTPEGLKGESWEQVRTALEYSHNRYQIEN